MYLLAVVVLAEAVTFQENLEDQGVVVHPTLEVLEDLETHLLQLPHKETTVQTASVLKAEAAVVPALQVPVKVEEMEQHLQSQEHLLPVLVAEAEVHTDLEDLAAEAADLEAVELEHLLHLAHQEQQVKLTLVRDLVEQEECQEFLAVDQEQMVPLV